MLPPYFSATKRGGKKKKKGVDKRGKIWYDKKALELGERKRPARGAEVFEN